jgi:hypothetical protein
MDDERPNLLPTGRDVAGAWLVCLLIAVLALGLASDLHRGVPPAATVKAEPSPCPPARDSVCQPSTEAAGLGMGTVARLHRLELPKPHPGEPDQRS